MPKGRLAPVTREQLIIQRLDALQEQIDKTRALMRVPSLPVYPDEPADAVEGELALIDMVPEYFHDGTWIPFAGDGIEFNKDNEGGWLYARGKTALSSEDSPDGSAFGSIMLVDDTGPGADSGVYIRSEESSIQLSAGSPGYVLLNSDNTAIIVHPNDIQVNLDTGCSFTVYGPGGATDKLFRVDADGTVHIKTGGTVVADL